MVFSSFVFVSIFLPLVWLVNRFLPVRWSNAFLLAASLFLYAWGEPVFVLLLVGCALTNYLVARLAGRAPRLALALALLANVGALCLFKYADFIISNLNTLFGLSLAPIGVRMPLGISFFTFQAMSYTIDVCRGQCAPQRSFPRLLLYIALFPQLIAGPIVKYREIERELGERSASLEDVALGARRFAVGLGKKVLLANALAVTADRIYALDPAALNMPLAWLGAVSYAFQIYFDFSGYTDMAVGMGRMMGFHFPENFLHPYAAATMRDFWRRWHVSLSSWFRDYVYIPLGGNRRGRARAVLNRLIVFFLTGLWHGASWNFVLWGLGNGALLMLESVVPVDRLRGKAKALGHVYVWLSFILLFVLFRADTLAQAGAVWRGMFAGPGMNQAQRLALAECLAPANILALLAAALCALPWKARLERLAGRARAAGRILSFAAALGIVWLSLMSLASQSYNPFIYFRF